MRKTHMVILIVSKDDYFRILEMIEPYKGIRTIVSLSKVNTIKFEITKKNLKFLEREIELVKKFGADVQLEVA